MSTLLQELDSFSLKITKAIELNDWEDLSAILTVRQARLESLSNTQLTVEEQRILESFQAMDKLFIDAVLSKKMELLKEFQTVAQGQKCVKAYYATAIN
ncbi:MAG: hypothetical protein PHC99_01555 [Methylococcales bacterium]|nr:hypothetical protein [Methylococcales bacterium]